MIVVRSRSVLLGVAFACSLSFLAAVSVASNVRPRATAPTKIADTTRVAPNICGDFNGDGSITATDALGTLQAAVGSVVCLVCVCDVDISGDIAATDALTTLQSAVGLPVVLTCQADQTPITWDGGGDGTSWTDPLNWDTDTRIPNGCDSVTIPAVAAVTITHDTGTNRAFSVVSDLPIDLNGGSLTLRDTIQVNDRFLLNGGTLSSGTLLESLPLPSIVNGAITNTTSSGSVVATDNHSTLVNMTVNAPVTFPGSNSGVDVVGGLTLNNTATLSVPGSRILFTGNPQTLSGTGEIVLGETNSFVSVSQGSSSSLTIGPDILIRGTGGSVGTNSGSLTFTNDGTIDSDMPGDIRVSGFGGLTNNGTFRASGGRLIVSHPWTNNGTVIAGPGQTVVSGAAGVSATDTAVLSPSSVVQIDIVGTTSFGLIEIRDIAALDGTLAINTMTNGTPLNLGDSFVVMTYQSKTGDFATITGTDIGGGNEFAVDVGATEVTLTVVAGSM